MTMTETATRTPGTRGGHSFRMWDATWDDVVATAKVNRADATKVINDAVEAALGYVRCYRCYRPVPARIGILGDRPLADFFPAAGKAVTAQRCTAHEPVTIGIGGDKAPEADRRPAGRTEPRRAAPGTVRFQQPGDEAPVIAFPVPEVPAGRNKKGRR